MKNIIWKNKDGSRSVTTPSSDKGYPVEVLVKVKREIFIPTEQEVEVLVHLPALVKNKDGTSETILKPVIVTEKRVANISKIVEVEEKQIIYEDSKAHAERLMKEKHHADKTPVAYDQPIKETT